MKNQDIIQTTLINVYLQCALSVDGINMDNLTIKDFTDASREGTAKQLLDFYAGIIPRIYLFCEADQLTHDFYLCRNGHDSNFEKGIYREYGHKLAKLANSFEPQLLTVLPTGQVDLC